MIHISLAHWLGGCLTGRLYEAVPSPAFEHLNEGVYGQVWASARGTRCDMLLLVIPSVVLGDRVESDFLNNLRVYAQNFDEVVFACPSLTPTQNEGYILRSEPMSELPKNVRYVQLPYTYREDTHLRHYFPIRRLLRELISKAEYLLFSPHAPFDWPTVAAREAIRMGRKYDLECDLDWNNLMAFRVASMKGPKKLRTALYARWMSHEVDRCLKHSAIALLQGKEVFEAYKDAAPNPRMVLNVQVDKSDHISEAELSDKLAHIRSGAPLRIMYAGQMTDRKGAGDWAKAAAGFNATWYGEGPHRIEGFNCPGIRPRDEIMAAMRKSDIFLFCHKVAESPRCLSEALASGCPLVGYDSAFPRGLVEDKGGGVFVPLGDWGALHSLLVRLDKDREQLAELVVSAAASGRMLERDAAMQHRVNLIKAA